MSTSPLCSFAGYVSEAGRKLIQDWYFALPQEEFEEIQDTLNYLASLAVTSWKRPEFDKVKAPLHEVRCKANEKNRVIRIYGVFDPQVRGRFIFLSATECKKSDHDKDGQKLALKRWNQGRAFTHEFSIEKKPDPQDTKK